MDTDPLRCGAEGFFILILYISIPLLFHNFVVSLEEKNMSTDKGKGVAE